MMLLSISFLTIQRFDVVYHDILENKQTLYVGLLFIIENSRWCVNSFLDICFFLSFPACF